MYTVVLKMDCIRALSLSGPLAKKAVRRQPPLSQDRQVNAPGPVCMREPAAVRCLCRSVSTRALRARVGTYGVGLSQLTGVCLTCCHTTRCMMLHAAATSLLAVYAVASRGLSCVRGALLCSAPCVLSRTRRLMCMSDFWSSHMNHSCFLLTGWTNVLQMLPFTESTLEAARATRFRVSSFSIAGVVELLCFSDGCISAL